MSETHPPAENFASFTNMEINEISETPGIECFLGVMSLQLMK